VTPGDGGALAARIVELSRDGERRRRMGETAGALVRARFSPVPIAQRFVALCEEAMSS
jgi:hypothetical protein